MDMDMNSHCSSALFIWLSPTMTCTRMHRVYILHRYIGLRGYHMYSILELLAKLSFFPCDHDEKNFNIHLMSEKKNPILKDDNQIRLFGQLPSLKLSRGRGGEEEESACLPVTLPHLEMKENNNK